MRNLTLLLTAALCLAAACPAHASGWYNDPWNGMVCVSNAPGNQGYPQVFAFSNGNYLISWVDHYDNGGQQRQYYQILNYAGVPLLEPNGRPLFVCDWMYEWASSDIRNLVPDGQGGCIVIVGDNRSGSAQVYGQHLDGLGNRLWGDTGLPLVIWPGNGLSIHDIEPDSLGHIFIAWTDYTAIGYRLYVQKVNLQGQRLWGDYGVMDCNPGNDIADAQRIVPDGQGGVMDVFEWFLNGSWYPHLFFQHIDSLGNLLLPITGTPLLHPNGSLVIGDVRWVVGDGQGGLVLVGTTPTGLESNIMCVMRLNRRGRTLWEWQSTVGATWSPGPLIRHPYDGYFWLTAGRDYGGQFSYLLLRFTPSGQSLLGLGGFGLDIGGDICWTWPRGVITVQRFDKQVEPQNSRFIVRKVDSTGTILWSSVLVQRPGLALHVIGTAPDGQGGFVGAWDDAINFSLTGYDIYAQHINSDGSLGVPNKIKAPIYPVITSHPNGYWTYLLTQAGPVKAEVYNLLGRKVATLEEGYKEAGTYRLSWDTIGRASGIYLIRLEAGGKIQILKTVVVR